MDIEIDLRQAKGWIGLVFVLVVLVLGLIGWAVTPPEGGVLTWEEWRLRKERVQYRREVERLQQYCDAMSALLNRPLDPLRAQALADRVLREMDRGGLAVLEPQRTAVAGAARALRQWALGDEREAAVQALQEAIQEVVEASHVP